MASIGEDRDGSAGLSVPGHRAEGPDASAAPTRILAAGRAVSAGHSEDVGEHASIRVDGQSIGTTATGVGECAISPSTT
jgi:hypothetical protein